MCLVRQPVLQFTTAIHRQYMAFFALRAATGGKHHGSQGESCRPIAPALSRLMQRTTKDQTRPQADKECSDIFIALRTGQLQFLFLLHQRPHAVIKVTTAVTRAAATLTLPYNRESASRAITVRNMQATQRLQPKRFEQHWQSMSDGKRVNSDSSIPEPAWGRTRQAISQGSRQQHVTRLSPTCGATSLAHQITCFEESRERMPRKSEPSWSTLCEILTTWTLSVYHESVAMHRMLSQFGWEPELQRSSCLRAAAAQESSFHQTLQIRVVCAYSRLSSKWSAQCCVFCPKGR